MALGAHNKLELSACLTSWIQTTIYNHRLLVRYSNWHYKTVDYKLVIWVQERFLMISLFIYRSMQFKILCEFPSSMRFLILTSLSPMKFSKTTLQSPLRSGIPHIVSGSMVEDFYEKTRNWCWCYYCSSAQEPISLSRNHQIILIVMKNNTKERKPRFG